MIQDIPKVQGGQQITFAPLLCDNFDLWQDFRFITAMRELPRHGPLDRRFEAITHFSELETKVPLKWWNNLVGHCVQLMTV